MEIKNKKAQAGELVQDTVGLVIVALLLIIFIIISTVLWGAPKKEIEKIATEQITKDQEHLSLQAWLQKTVEIEIEEEKQDITIAELIRLSKINPIYEEILNQEAEKSLGIYNYEFNKQAGSLFYIPSDEIITIRLEIK
ncbi:MAG: hypothetical protein IB618_03435 [Candidatus Pacearchaeota archaeon]|nr:MAG: hypothetical protein IB618_03435 [Candidatus Pacearchaeota archaeon]